MLDGGHSGAKGRLDSLGSVGVGGDSQAVTGRFFDDGNQLFFGVLLSPNRAFEGIDAGRGAHLDDPGTVLDLLANRFQDLIHTVCNSESGVLGPDSRGKAGEITVAPGDGQGVP